MAGCTRERVRPSKMPQSGPAAEEMDDVAAQMDAVASETLPASLSMLLDSKLLSSGEAKRANEGLAPNPATVGWGFTDAPVSTKLLGTNASVVEQKSATRITGKRMMKTVSELRASKFMARQGDSESTGKA